MKMSLKVKTPPLSITLVRVMYCSSVLIEKKVYKTHHYAGQFLQSQLIKQSCGNLIDAEIEYIHICTYIK